MTIYHKEVGFPISHPRPQLGLRLTYSRHALDKMDLNGIASVPTVLKPYELIEIYFEGHKLVKYVIRTNYNRSYDLCLVIHPDGFVRTCWLNSCTDTHRTLDRSRYTIPTPGGHNDNE